MIRFLTAGESHGRCLIGILEGLPSGLDISEDEIRLDLARRQLGYGRGGRMQIEQDYAQILAGVRYGATLGSPLALMIENRDWPNWEERMRIDAPSEAERTPPLTRPRPGHADLAGAIKYNHTDIRNVIERSSARETASRVALGAVCRKFFRSFGVSVGGHVVNIGGQSTKSEIDTLKADEINRKADQNPVRCLDAKAAERMIQAIDRAKSDRDTLGGIFEIIIDGLPVGVGSYVHSDRRLNSILSAAMTSIPAMKSVGIGIAETAADQPGSSVHDQLVKEPDSDQVLRSSNRAGGIEGGMSTGDRVRIRVAMKPLATLGQPLASVDMATGEAVEALRERSDVCAVPAAAVVGEAVALLALMNPFLEKFGGDSMSEIRRHFEARRGSPWD